MVVSEYLYPNQQAPWLFHSFMELSLTDNTTRALKNGLVCRSVVTKGVGEVFCRCMRRMFLGVISKGDNMPEGYTGVSYDGQIICSGEEPSFSECDVTVYNVTSCASGYAVIDCTPGK